MQLLSKNSRLTNTNMLGSLGSAWEPDIRAATRPDRRGSCEMYLFYALHSTGTCEGALQIAIINARHLGTCKKLQCFLLFSMKKELLRNRLRLKARIMSSSSCISYTS